MITNFEYQTEPLNELEERAACIIANCLLSSHRGKHTAVSAEKIGKGMAKTFPEFVKVDKKGQSKPYLTGARIRKIINRIRVEDRVPFLLANGEGYYVSDDPQEIRDYIRSVRERISAMEMMANCVERQLHKAFENTQYVSPIKV